MSCSSKARALPQMQLAAPLAVAVTVITVVLWRPLNRWVPGMLVAALGMLIGQAYDGTAVPMSSAMVAAGFLALLLVLYSERGVLFRRLHPPGR